MLLITPTYNISGSLDPSRRREVFGWRCSLNCWPKTVDPYRQPYIHWPRDWSAGWDAACGHQTKTSDSSYSYRLITALIISFNISQLRSLLNLA